MKKIALFITYLSLIGVCDAQEYDQIINSHLKLGGSIIERPAETYLAKYDDKFDAQAAFELRLMNEHDFSYYFHSQIHLQLIADYSSYYQYYPSPQFEISDDTRLFKLTRKFKESDSSYYYLRLDRASITYNRPDYSISLGRQITTWGTGFIFNVLDIFNPFSPSAISKDYKAGEDMLIANIYAGNFSLELISLIYSEQGSAALKVSNGARFSFDFNSILAELIVARHKNLIIGTSLEASVLDSIFRLDFAAKKPDYASMENRYYLSWLANLDYSWVSFEKNFYAFVELFYNELAPNNYSQIYTDTYYIQAFRDKEQFTLAPYYLASALNMEVSPLLNCKISYILNLKDYSKLTQLVFSYNLLSDTDLSLAVNQYSGAKNTEYGGFEIPGQNYIHKPASSLYFEVSSYF